MERKHPLPWFWSLILPVLLACSVPARAVEPLRIGLTPTFLSERHALIADWRTYLEGKMGRPVAFVMKESYEQTMELLHQRQIDVAWLCDCPHVTSNPEFRLLVTPLFKGRPYYRSYVIVPESDHHTSSLNDLKDKVFAYSDPYSNAGYMNPRYELKKQGIDPDYFFRRTFFAHSHLKAIEAVAVGVADAASVNSYIWETLNQQDPTLTGKTRVATRSAEYGFPPIVAYHTVPAKDFEALQQALIGMSDAPLGREVLGKMNLTGFALPQRKIYQPVREIIRFMEQH
jgi:phosphonate transport system substrate-binding protein